MKSAGSTPRLSSFGLSTPGEDAADSPVEDSPREEAKQDKPQDIGCHRRIASNFVVQCVAAFRVNIYIYIYYVYVVYKNNVYVCGLKACKVLTDFYLHTI